MNLLPVLAAALLAQADVSAPFVTGATQVPYGDADMSMVVNYSRAAPNIGVGGRVDPDRVDELASLGFRTLIDLRGADEDGVGALEEAARGRIDYRRMTMPRTDDEIEAFLPELRAALDETDSYPILLHCGSSNRAGAAWALYRAAKGVPAIVAIEEGRAAGMRSREAAVRRLMGLDEE